MTTWTVDTNKNVMVDSNEDAMLYLGMRRGGSNYYAFDISNRENPKLQWVIQGGEGEFESLGQSWSRMVPTKILYRGEERNVLIFGGGYDVGNDVDYSIGAQPKEADTIGRAIFIVDSLTGDLIYQIGHSSDSQADQRYDEMDFAIPSDIRVLDVDGNGRADSLFFGDLGGQVWRFDFNLAHQNGDLLQGGVLAALGLPHSDITNNRRFFYEPDVALIRENGNRYLSLSIGSGWRSHPLNTDVQDSFYVIRSSDVYNLPAGYGKQNANGSYTPITEADLTDVSDSVNNTIGRYGWRLDFNDPGEKVLGDALTVNNQVVFTTFLPESSADSCTSAIGTGSIYAMSIIDARPSLDLDGSEDEDGPEDGVASNNNGNRNNYTVEDRSAHLNHGGPPPDATALIVEGQVNGETVITPTILVGPEQPLDGIFSENLTERSFWIDAGMTEDGAVGASID